MLGQGGPKTSRRSISALARVRCSSICQWLAVASLLCIASAKADAETLRLRIAWGGGAERLWRGAIAVRDGLVLEPQPLGLEADESGSMWLEQGQLSIFQRSPRSYDGVDLLVDAPLEATLLIHLTASREEGRPSWIEIPLADLVGREVNRDLDDRGNRLSVRRTPGDQIRVRLAQRSLVFAPEDVLTGQVEPHLLPMEPGAKVRVSMRLTGARAPNEAAWSMDHPLGPRTPSDFWSEDHTVVAGEAARTPIPLSVTLPKQEGAYDLVITATHAGMIRFPQPGRAALVLKQPIVERRIQLVVLGHNRLATRPELEPLKEVVEIDPANPKWWERFASSPPQLGKLPRLGKPLSNGRLQPCRHSLGVLAQLAPNPKNGEISWEAYTLPVNRPGAPHVLEVDYPSDVPQTVGISIIEPNAAGAVIPIGLDSGIDQAGQLVSDLRPPQWLHHRMVFWPRTKSPIVLISNRRSDAPAIFGRIRVLDGWEHLPSMYGGQEPPARLWAAYMDRPLVPENFSASEALGSLSDLSVDDWRTFYEGGTRLVEYLNHVGYNGLMLSVWADGSAIYPSKILESTPRYDTGTFLSNGQDPVRKDVLEMLFRLFDREHLQLVPAMEFTSPLPELEAILRAGGQPSEGIQWIGADGKVWQQAYPPVRGMAAYYNILHPQVQDAILAVIHEVAANYTTHPSFAGLALQLSGNGYLQLPGPRWGMDDVTIARFSRDTKIEVPGSGPGRFATRAQFLTGPGRQAWLQWRADQLTRFYQRVRDDLRALHPETRLYLAGANMFTGAEISHELMPALPRRLAPAEALLWVGIDARQYQQDRGVVLLCPEMLAPEWSMADQAVNLEINQVPEWDRIFQGFSLTGSLFFHKPQEVRLASFDEKSPFRPTYTWLATQAVPSGPQNRRRFVHALATIDTPMMFDGGWQLSLGQEGTLKDLVAIYRRLPAARFDPIADLDVSQPVVVRSATSNSRTWAYAANDAPFTTELKVRVTAPAGCQIEELTGLRRVPPLARDAQGAYWQLSLAPYEVVAVEFSTPDVKLSDPKVTWSSNVYAALQKRIAELADRAASLRSPPLLSALRNGDFELPPGSQGSAPGWAVPESPGVKVSLDAKEKHGGNQSLRLSSTGGVASLISQPFDVPNTGRLSLSVWLRTADVTVQPQLSIAVEGRYPLFRAVRVGSSGQAPISAQWTPFVVTIPDLPLEGLSSLQVRFDLMGAGEVWIDDIQLSSLAFSKPEHVELVRLIAPADAKLQSGQVGDCMRLLQGYWPRFLLSQVPMPEIAVSQHPEPAEHQATPTEEAPAKGFLGRVKQILPDKLRLY